MPKRFGTFTSHDFQDTYIFEMLKTGLMIALDSIKRLFLARLELLFGSALDIPRRRVVTRTKFS